MTPKKKFYKNLLQGFEFHVTSSHPEIENFDFSGIRDKVAQTEEGNNSAAAAAVDSRAARNPKRYIVQGPIL